MSCSIQQIFLEGLLCARLCSRHWRYCKELPCPQRADDKDIVYRVLVGAPEQKEAAVGDGSAEVCTLGLECRFKWLDQKIFIEEVTFEPRPEGVEEKR